MFSWNDFIGSYQKLIDEIEKKLNSVNKRFSKQIGYAPIDDIRSRIKSEDSIRRKLDKKGLEFNEKNISQIKDLAGIRVICRFLDDIPELVSVIRSWQTLKVVNNKDSIVCDQIIIVKEKDYITEPKQSGYRSYHIICRKNNLLFEIQLRTLAMNFWATNEHMLKYKYGDNIPEDIKRLLKDVAEIADTLDNSMNNIRQDVKIGTAKSRVLEQIYKAIHILEQSNMKSKAEFYREEAMKNNEDLEKLRSIAIRAKEDVPKQYWI